jgi:hypothetical protein
MYKALYGDDWYLSVQLNTGMDMSKMQTSDMPAWMICSIAGYQEEQLTRLTEIALIK